MAHSVNRVLKSMLWVKLAGVTSLVLTAALAASAAVALVYRDAAEKNPEQEPPVAAVAPRQAEPRQSEPRTDAQGDRLPEGAIARLGSVRFRYGGHIARIGFAPDGKRLMVQGDEGVQLWDAAAGKELMHLAHGAMGPWAGGDLSPDGKLVAVSRHIPADGPIDFWDVASGKRVGSLGEKFGPPVRFSPDGKLLVACPSSRAEVDIWDLSTHKKLRSWKAHVSQVLAVAFSSDSRQLLTTGTEAKARLWDVATGRKLQEFTPSGWKADFLNFPPFETALSPNGRLAAMPEWAVKVKPAGWEARISLWDATTGKRLRQLVCPSKENSSGWGFAFGALAFSPDGKKIITGGPDNFIRIWDAAKGEELRRLRFEPGPISSLALSKDGKTLAAAVRDSGAVCLVDLESGQMKAAPPGHLTEVRAAILTPDSRTAITSSSEDALLVWDVATGRPRRLEGHGSPVHSLYLTPDGKTLLSGGWDEKLRVWDLATGRQRRQLDAPLPKTGTGKIYVSPDSKNLVVVDGMQTIRLLDAATGEERQHFGAPKWILGWALTPDGSSLVGWSGDRKVRIWDVANGKLRHEHPIPEAGNPQLSLYVAALSPDGRLLAVGSEEKPGGYQLPRHYLLLVEAATGREILRLDKVSSTPKCICFSPDGRMLSWGAVGDAAAHLAETATGRQRRRIDGHRGFVSSLAFSTNGDRLISGSVDTTALVWDLGVGAAPKPLTPAEVETLWADLARADAARAYQAIRKLASAPTSSVPFLRKRLRPIAPVDEKHLARSIADLDSEHFAVREKATPEMEKLGDRALPAYRKALANKPTLESRRRLEDLLDKAQRAWWDVTGERLRSLRAVEALELAGTKEAREVLKALADGAAGARLTEEANAALKRLLEQR